mgnify:CR=1 FL=1
MSEPEVAAEEGTEDGVARVFLSYSRKDRERAQRIADVLRERHFGVFKDTDDILPTEEWQDRLQSLIEEADTIVFLLSPNSVHSEVCAWEVEYATSLNKRVAPIVIDDTDANDIPPLLARLNFIFCTDRDPFENAINTLVSALNTDIDWIREHTRLAGLAQRWHAAGRAGRLLLRGEDIADAERWRDRHPPEAPQVTELQAAFIAESRRAATRRQRITVVLSLSALVVGLGLAALAFWQREIAVEQQALAVEEKNQALIAQSHYLADIASDELLLGDGTLAILTALEAIRDETSDDPQQRSRPHVNEARAALADAVVQRREIRMFADHTDGLTFAAFSPDGARLVTMDWDNHAMLWDVASGGLIAELEGHASTPRMADFSSDGKLLVTAGDDGGARLWDGATGTPLRVFESDRGGVSTVAFSSDGQRILTGKGEVFDAATGERVLALSLAEDKYWDAHFSPDDSQIITFGTFRVDQWDARTGDLIRSAETSDNHELFDQSSDGEHYLISVSYGAARISVHRRDGGSRLYEIGSPDDAGILSARFSPDGKQIATGSQDGRARVWNVLGKKLMATMLGHTGAVNSIHFSPDGAQVITASEDGSARVWDAATGKELTRLAGHGGGVTGARFSPDGVYALTWSWDGTARLWNWRREAEAKVLWTQVRDGSVNRAIYTPDGARVLTGRGHADGVKVWDTRSGALLHHLRNGRDIALSDSGEQVVVVVNHRDVELRRLHDLEWNKTFSLGRGPSVNFSPRMNRDGSRLLFLVGNAAELWQIGRDKFLDRRVSILRHDDQIDTAAFSPDGRFIATASRDNRAGLWDAETGQLIAYLEGYEKQVRAVAFSPDGALLVTGDFDGHVKVWDVAGQTLLHKMEGHLGGILSMDVAADGVRAASASWDGTVRLWDIRTGSQIASYDAHESQPNFVLFSPEGQSVSSTWEDGVTRLHDVATGAPVAVYRGHVGEVQLPAFAPDGQQLATPSWDGSVRLWPVWKTSAELIAHAKRIVPRCLTPLERENLHLRPRVPAWCVEMKKWPYDKPDWRNRPGVE